MTASFHTVEAVAERLGMSEKGIRKWMHEGRIAYVKYGKSRTSAVRISESELQRFLAAGVRPKECDAMTKQWRVGKQVPYNVYGENDRPICQCHTVLDAKRIVEAVNDRDANARDWKQIAEALGFRPSDALTRDEIVVACRALVKGARP
jgi:excisionase family DNA binding protein